MAGEIGPKLARGSAEVAASISIPEIRDYQRINGELIARLDEGYRSIRLTGADGHRLLVAGIVGKWNAIVEIEGNVGPEIGFSLDAPGLTVICRGNTADGAGSCLKSGRLVVLGSAGNCLGYSQSGGEIVVFGNSGHRAGLNQSGGRLVLLGDTGRLLGERQSGGVIHFDGVKRESILQRENRRGLFVAFSEVEQSHPAGSQDSFSLQGLREELKPWLSVAVRGF